MTQFKTSVRIGCPLEEVFAFVSEPLNFPHWNSAVRAVRKTRGRDGEVGSTYTMERELPIGRVENELEVFARRQPSELGIRTTSGPTPFSHRYTFSAANAQALVELDAVVELDGPAALLGPLAGRAIKRGVDDNFAELKRILEARLPRRRAYRAGATGLEPATSGVTACTGGCSGSIGGIYRVDRWVLPIPGGIPLRGVGYFAVALGLVLLAGNLRAIGSLLGALSPPLRYRVRTPARRGGVSGSSASSAGSYSTALPTGAASFELMCSPGVHCASSIR